ncbi:Imm57 family immunity protein, partial [Escherichia coli]|uniref:Imm57 family immunity protein n=1 Tax=Escherichia coli TaxID=562 RepID=UPI00313F0326
ADRNRSHWSTSKTPSYTKSVSWQHHQGKIIRPYLKNLNPLQLAADCIETVNKIKDKNKKIIDINSVNICSDDKNIKLRVNSTIMAIDDSIKCIDE